MARWSVYIVRCGDGSLYTGIATDVRRRIAEHARRAGRGAKYLRGRGPLRLVFAKAIGARGAALRIESRIKKLPKARKEDLIRTRERLLLLALSLVTLLGCAGSPDRTVLAFRRVAVIDGTGGPPAFDQTVVVSGSRIAAVGPSDAVAIPPTARVVEGEGLFMIPGLWDMHTHVFNQISRRPPNEWYFPLMVANGVTSIREMWTRPGDVPKIRNGAIVPGLNRTFRASSSRALSSRARDRPGRTRTPRRLPRKGGSGCDGSKPQAWTS